MIAIAVVRKVHLSSVDRLRLAFVGSVAFQSIRVEEEIEPTRSTHIFRQNPSGRIRTILTSRGVCTPEFKLISQLRNSTSNSVASHTILCRVAFWRLLLKTIRIHNVLEWLQDGSVGIARTDSKTA